MPAVRQWTGRVCAERVGQRWLLWPEGAVRPDPAWFDALAEPASDTDSSRRGRGSTRAFVAGGAWVLLRHYRRGGMARRIAADRYAWLGLTRTRPWRELAVSARLAGAGLPVAPPIGARVIRAPGRIAYRGDLITRYLDDTETLSARVRHGGVTASQWRRIGATIADFHDAGLDHADLNAHNVLIDTSGRVYLIDFDRARLRRPGRWQQRNMARLRRSLDKLFASADAPDWSEAAWQQLLAGYRRD